MLQRVRAAQPEAHLHGFTVQAMVRRPRAQELIVGASLDPLFGPVILFGQGGTAVEVVADRALALPPLNRRWRARWSSARAWRSCWPAGATRRRCDMDALVGVLTAVSQLLAEVPQIAELDINPLLADADGVIALDARVRVERRRAGRRRALRDPALPERTGRDASTGRAAR